MQTAAMPNDPCASRRMYDGCILTGMRITDGLGILCRGPTITPLATQKYKRSKSDKHAKMHFLPNC